MPLAHDVAQFLLTDRSALPAEFRASASDEQLLVAQDGDEMTLGLFLEPAVLARLAAANPLDALHGGNLADYWTALEGVSHFVYLAWNAGHDRPVGLLELELQAEVDKYVCSVQLLRAQDPTRFPAELHRVLFESARVIPRWRASASGSTAGPITTRRASAGTSASCCGPWARRRRRARAELRRFYRLTSAHEAAAHRVPGLGP